MARDGGEPDTQADVADDDRYDDEEQATAFELAGPELTDRTDPHSGKTVRIHPQGWPREVTFGDDDWRQLRWRPYPYLEQGQRWMDRFELGEYWWQAIYSDERFRTERKFEVWRKDRKNWCRGVVWAAPTPHGRLDEPALAVVVVLTARGRRTATWPLFLPNPAWSPAMRQHYIDRRLAGETDWRQLTQEVSAMATAASDIPHQLAAELLRARLEARRRRRS